MFWITILVWALYVIAIGAALYAVIRFAIVHALRQARHEERIEQRVPKAATWLKGEERRLLEISNSVRDRR